MSERPTLWSCVLNMTIASYLHPKPKADAQIRLMAKRYLRNYPTINLKAKRTFKNVVNCTNPTALVQIAYDEMTKE